MGKLYLSDPSGYDAKMNENARHLSAESNQAHRDYVQ